MKWTYKVFLFSFADASGVIFRKRGYREVVLGFIGIRDIAICYRMPVVGDPTM